MDEGPVVGLTCRTLALRSAERLRPAETVARTYVEALRGAGARTLLVPNLPPEEAPAYLALLDGVLLTGGDDPHPHLFGEEPHPRIEVVDERRDRFEIALVRGAHARDLPVLGICRGMQLMNIALGGDIHQDIASQTESSVLHAQRRTDDGPWHVVDVAETSLLAPLLGPGRRAVNSFHHQACRQPGQGLRYGAVCVADGLPEALEDPSRRFFLGVQWHAELGAADGAGDHAIFARFVAAAREARALSSKEVHGPRPGG